MLISILVLQMPLCYFCYSVIDVGSEWRTFSNEKANADPSRVGGPENALLNGSDLTTIIGGGKGDAAFDEFGAAKYANRRNITSADRALMNAFREIGQMAERINLPRTITDRANNLFKVRILQLQLLSVDCYNRARLYKTHEQLMTTVDLLCVWCSIDGA